MCCCLLPLISSLFFSRQTWKCYSTFRSEFAAEKHQISSAKKYTLRNSLKSVIKCFRFWLIFSQWLRLFFAPKANSTLTIWTWVWIAAPIYRIPEESNSISFKTTKPSKRAKEDDFIEKLKCGQQRTHAKSIPSSGIYFFYFCLSQYCVFHWHKIRYKSYYIKWIMCVYWIIANKIVLFFNSHTLQTNNFIECVDSSRSSA